jgi:hypothetical protein
MGNDRVQCGITDGMGELLDIRVVTHVHDLGDDPLWHLKRLSGRFPPNILAGKLRQHRLIASHGCLSWLVGMGGVTVAVRFTLV